MQISIDAESIGSLVVNPGGPGGSGVEYAAGGSSYFGKALLRSFDIVGLDPRGVGESSPVECVGDTRLDAFLASDPDPDSRAEFRQGHRFTREFFAGCMQRDAELARHVSRVYLHIDLDVHEPSEAQANQYAVPGGLAAGTVRELVRVVAGRFSIAAAALTAYDPTYDGRMLDVGLRLMEEIANSYALRAAAGW